jgi:proteasome lid subunit RPN8/RPN11
MRTMIAHARAARPAECCGVLLGSADRIVSAVPIRNESTALDRYRLDPRQHIAARREARERGLAVLGFYHSHPHSPARPSPVDLAEATYPELVYIIVGLAGSDQDSADPSPAGDSGAVEVRAFRFHESGYTELTLTTDESVGPKPAPHWTHR